MKSSRFGVLSYSFTTAGHGPVFWGILLLIPLVLVFGIWACLAPLNAAAIAPGRVTLSAQRKTVQHLEGGILEQILVEEGQKIEKGTPILIVRDLQQRTQINTLYDQLASARALHRRLLAEVNKTPAPDFSGFAQDLILAGEVKKNLIKAQMALFETRLSALTTKIALIKARKQQIRKEIEALGFQQKALKKQISLVEKELNGISELYAKQLATLSRKISLEQHRAELEGQKAALEANTARLKQSLVSADIEVLDLKNARQNESLDALQANELHLQELSHQLEEKLDQLNRTVIKAPTEGRVIDLQVHTRGAVISPGQRLLDIVPLDDQLVIDARVRPDDIDLVRAGTKAKIILSAYKAKKLPKLDGTTLHVSGDVLTDELSGEPYFLARVRVEEKMLDSLKENITLQPGMTTQVFFLSEARSLASYLLSPLLDATYRAFREE